MSARTPGPWSLNEAEQTILGADQTVVFLLAGSSENQRSEAEYAANARLIAAAPEMLAELKKIVGWLDRLKAAAVARSYDTRFKTLADANAADARNYHKTIEHIAVVIAKAEGGL